MRPRGRQSARLGALIGARWDAFGTASAAVLLTYAHRGLVALRRRGGGEAVGGLGSGPGAGVSPSRSAAPSKIGELCTAGRRPCPAPRRGPVARHGTTARLLARLSYAITRAGGAAEAALCSSPTATGPRARALDMRSSSCSSPCPGGAATPAARAVVAACCASTHPRVHSTSSAASAGASSTGPRRSASTLAYVAEVAGPTLRELAALPVRVRRRPRRRYVERPPSEARRSQLESELPLAEQELRLWCLRLRGAGLSYRQIAALAESSKSSVARICAAGRAGIDTRPWCVSASSATRPGGTAG